MITIHEARTSIENKIRGLAIGTGINYGSQEIIVYVNDFSSEQKIRNTIENETYGFNLKFVHTGTIRPL